MRYMRTSKEQRPTLCNVLHNKPTSSYIPPLSNRSISYRYYRRLIKCIHIVRSDKDVSIQTVNDHFLLRENGRRSDVGSSQLVKRKRSRANTCRYNLKQTVGMIAEAVLSQLAQSISRTKVVDKIVDARAKTRPIRRVTDTTPLIPLRLQPHSTHKNIRRHKMQPNLSHI